MARAFRRGGPRRKTQWGGMGTRAGGAGPGVPVTQATGVATIVSQGIITEGGSAGLLDDEITITRMIGEVFVQTNDAAAEQASVAVGCYVARGEAISAGVGSLPDPGDDPGAEWLYYFAGGMVQDQAAVQGVESETIRMPFDVKGQRIVRSGSSVVWVALLEGGPGFVAVNGRYLVKLA